MDGLDPGALIVIGALAIFLLIVLPVAYRYDRRLRRTGGKDASAGAFVATSATTFSDAGASSCGDGGGNC